MPQFYLDTSALLPYYHKETASNTVQTFLETLDKPPTISALTKVEFSSALARWVRMRELQETEANKIQQKFELHLANGLYQIHDLDQACFMLAERWMIQRTGVLRTLDALHLATSVQMDVILVTCDKALADAAQILSCRCLFLDHSQAISK